MIQEVYQVGDLVKIKEWKDMEAEYGISPNIYDSINVPFEFTQEMRYLCGEVLKIKEIDPDYYGNVRYTLASADFHRMEDVDDESIGIIYDEYFSKEMFTLHKLTDAESEDYNIGSYSRELKAELKEIL